MSGSNRQYRRQPTEWSGMNHTGNNNVRLTREQVQSCAGRANTTKSQNFRRNRKPIDKNTEQLDDMMVLDLSSLLLNQVSFNKTPLCKTNAVMSKKKNAKWTKLDLEPVSIPKEVRTSNGRKTKKTASKQSGECPESVPQILGKRRENPRKKKPTKLKKVIMQQRNENQIKRDMPDWRLDEPGQPAWVDLTESDKIKFAKRSIHSRRFRSYCDHSPKADIDVECSLLLKLLHHFQQRARKENPMAARTKLRFVVGLRQISKYVKAGLVKCVLMAPNCEIVRGQGGLDCMINNILEMCKDQNVTCVFTMSKSRLGRCLKTPVAVSAVGVLDYNGANVVYNKMKSLVDDAKTEYSDLLKRTIDKISLGDLSIPSASCGDNNQDNPTEESDMGEDCIYYKQEHQDESFTSSPSRQEDIKCPLKTMERLGVPTHARNLSGTLRVIKPQHNRAVVYHNRQPSDLCSHLCTNLHGSGNKPLQMKPFLPIVDDSFDEDDSRRIQKELDEYNDKVNGHYLSTQTMLPQQDDDSFSNKDANG